MGADLKVMASHFRELRGEFLVTASLRLERDEALLGRLAPEADPCLVNTLPPGLKVGHCEDEGLRWDDVDRYGARLTYTTPAALQMLRLPDQVSPWNRAAL